MNKRTSKTWDFGDARQQVIEQLGDPREPAPLASNCVRHLDALVKENSDLKAVLWVRASRREQERQKNLENQQASLLREVEARGVTVIGASSRVPAEARWLGIENVEISYIFLAKLRTLKIAYMIFKFIT